MVTEGPAGERFFTAEGLPTQTALDNLTLLRELEQSSLATAAACAALQKHKLIRPWTITVKAESGDQQIAGLFQVDEAALNQLSGEALLELREAGALPLAYCQLPTANCQLPTANCQLPTANCQLLSMQHLPVLGELTGAHANVAAKAEAARKMMAGGDLDLGFLNQGGTVSFGNLR